MQAPSLCANLFAIPKFFIFILINKSGIKRSHQRGNEKLNENKGIEERLDRVNRKLDLLTVIILVNSGMKLTDIARAVGVSVRTIQNWLPVAKLKYAKGRKGQTALEERAEASIEDETQSTSKP